MEFINGTRMNAGYTLGVEPSGRELLIVAVKGTFRLPTEPNARLQLHDNQVPLVMSDLFFGEPGLSAPKYEVDFAPRKPLCDVLLNGHAYAPQGRPTDRLTVGLRIGNWSKSFSVVGDRAWYLAGRPRATAPLPFIRMPLSYDHAFGGVDLRHSDPARHAAFMPNPSGRGFHQHFAREWLEGSPLPNTEEPGVPVTQPDGQYRPMSFGGLGRHWEPRARYAGTYDQQWLDKVFPFLPHDFDARYFQTAPPDQQLALPVGEQRVLLMNLTPDGRREFTLPHFDAPVHIFPKKDRRENLLIHADTLIIEPDEERITLTWRVARPLRRNIFEIAQVLIGWKSRGWWRARESGKTYYPSLAHAVRTVERV